MCCRYEGDGERMKAGGVGRGRGQEGERGEGGEGRRGRVAEEESRRRAQRGSKRSCPFANLSHLP